MKKRKLSALLGVIILVPAMLVGTIEASLIKDVSMQPEVTTDSFIQDIEGLKVWYDAQDLDVQNGQKVSTWQNKAGSKEIYDAIQLEEGKQPIYEMSSKINEMPGIRMEKDTYFQLKNQFNLEDMAIFAVINVDALEGDGDSNQIFSKLGDSNGWNHNWYFNINRERFNYGWKDTDGYHDYVGNNNMLTKDTNYILGGVKDKHKGNLYVNGAKVGTIFGNTNNPTPVHNNQPIIIGGTGNSESIEGVISEIIVYDRGLSEKETAQVNDYLSLKWGIELSSIESVNGVISIDGEPIPAFSPNCKTYKHVIDNSEIPKVTAEFPKATKVEIQQVESIPGTARISVHQNSVVTQYSIELSSFEGELVNLTMPEVEQVEITEGFWKEKLDLFREETIVHIFNNFERTGTLENFKKVGIAGARPLGSTAPWNDGLLYETIRGASDFMRANPEWEGNAELEDRIDGYVDIIYEASMKSEDGYLSTWSMMERPGQYFDETGNARWYHDAYNFGCLTEAAVHYYKATGKIKLLYVSTRFAEFLIDNYGYGIKEDGTPKINMIPSHEGPEEMLLKLYELYRDNPELKSSIEQYNVSDSLNIDENEYADLVKFWIENHGNYDNRVNGVSYGEYAQDHARYFDQEVAVGHAVRANLFYTGMAAAGREFKDYTYLSTAQKLWKNIVEKQMYITGGVGAQGADEAYGPNYDLPNDGYCETCAQVAMGFFSQHMTLALGEAEYASLVEKYTYDGVLGAIGEDGKSFYYQQPLTDKNRGRWDWIEQTPCCPPMFLKFYGEMPSYIYAYNNDEVYVNQFVSSKLNVEGISVSQETQMPWGGRTTLIGSGVSSFYIRLPEWADQSQITIAINDVPYAYTVKNGYAKVDVNDGDIVVVDFPMEVRREYSNENVIYNRGKVALGYGPLVYCIESKDVPLYVPNFNVGEGNIGIPKEAELRAAFEPELLGGVVTIGLDAQYYDTNGELQTAPIKAIPFFARANRGSASTYVWVDENVKPSSGKMNRWLASATDTREYGNSAAAAFDGNLSTYWAAGNSDVPQAVVVDLGEMKQVGSIKTTFTSAQAWKYQVLYSNDGENWEISIDNSSNTTNQQVYIDEAICEARYIAIKFVESAGVGYISVQEIEVMGQGANVNLAKNKLCGASSVSNVGKSVFAMIDGNKETRYCPSGEAKPQSLTMDLGEVVDITGMNILFEKPTEWTYQIDVSEDGKVWTNYISETWNMPSDHVERKIEKEARGRYVRFSITGTTGGVWASVWEFDVEINNPAKDIFDTLLKQSLEVSMSGEAEVNKGETFDITLSVDKMTKPIYGEDLTIKYDPEVLVFKGVKAIAPTLIVEEQESTPGEIRILSITEKGITEKIDLLTLEFYAKDIPSNQFTRITLTDVQLGAVVDEQSSIVRGENVEKEIKIRKLSEKLDKAVLSQLIEEATGLYEKAVVGDKLGQYPIEVKESLKAAADKASNLFEQIGTIEELNQAVEELAEAIRVFKASAIKGMLEDINVDGKVDVADLALVAYYYQIKVGDAEWKEAEREDLDGDGIISIGDLTLVANKILE